jgi:hypothetical protein
MGEGFWKRAAANHMVDIATGVWTQMTHIELENLAERVVSAIRGSISNDVKAYTTRALGEMRTYLDSQIETLKAHDTKQLDDALIAQIKGRVGYEIAEALTVGALAELSGAERNLERRVGRHAEHLANLQASVRALEGKKSEGKKNESGSQP